MLSNFTYGQGGTPQLSEDLAYETNGNLISVTDLVDGTRNKAFGYDGLQRLNNTRANSLWGGTESYTYDALNNLRTRVLNGTTYTYNYDEGANRLSAIVSGATTINSFGYDSRGNVIDKNGNSLVFDQKNQLTQIPGFGSYDYDHAGRRVRKVTADGEATYYFYNQNGQLLYQYDGATTKQTNYIYLGKKLVARNENFGSQVLGVIDGVSVDSSGQAAVTGWACSKGIAQSINVHLYVGGPAGSGTVIEGVTANQSSEPAVASSCGVTTGNYRFSLPLSDAVRTQYAGKTIYVHGISPVGADNLTLSNSGEFTVPAAGTTATLQHGASISSTPMKTCSGAACVAELTSRTREGAPTL